MEEKNRWQFSLIEKLVGTAMIGLLVWQTVTTQTMAVDVAVMKAQFEAATNDRFRASDGALLEMEIQRNLDRIKALEEQMEDVR